MASRHGRRGSPFGSRLLGSADQSVRVLRVRVQLLLTLLLGGTNLIGAGIVFVVSTFLVPAPSPNRSTVIALAVAVPVYTVAAIVIGAVIGTARALRALRWATERETPDERERDRALRVPLQLTVMSGLLWLGAVVLFTVLALVLQPQRALPVALSVGIAGVVVCAVAFLLTEFVLRPVSARALADAPVTRRPRGAGVGTRLMIFWSVGTAAPLIGLMVASILALTGNETSLTELGVVAISLCGIVLVFGLLITVLSARAVVSPLLATRDALLAVEQGDLDTELVVYDGTEMGLLQAGFNQMVAGLREREQIRDMFGRHVGREVAQAASRGEVELGGETRDASVLFIDLVGSTTYAVDHEPAEVVDMLNRFFGVVVDEVDRHHGLVNKFIGDAVLAVFGAPVDLDDHAGEALAAARAMAARLAEEVPEIGAGIGVSTGEVVAGNVGHEERFEYTVIGDAVNSAARLTDLAKEVDGHVLVTWASVEAADSEEAGHWRKADPVTLRGRDEETQVAVLAS